MNEIEQYFICPYCGETISMFLDVSATQQQYVEDCEVCCRPMKVSIEYDDDGIPNLTAETDT